MTTGALTEHIRNIVKVGDQVFAVGELKTNIWKGKTFKEFSQTEEYKQYLDDPLKIKSNEETYFDVYKKVENIYEKETQCVFVSHQDTIRSFTYYKLKDELFNNNKPEHCGIHEIINNKLMIHTYPA